MPNMLNKNYCKFIKYGVHNIGNVLAKSDTVYYCESIIHQINKKDRNFIYHIKYRSSMLTPFNRFYNNGRKY